MPPHDASWPPRQPTAGAMLGPYRLDAQIGAGGMGVVFRALDTRLNRAVAVKVIGIDAAAHEHGRDRFLREARAASTLNHPNVVTIHEVDSVDGVDFIVMELIEGRSLAQRLADGPVSIDEGLAVAEQIGSALEAAHAAGLVHRDVKPANVMLTPTGHVKVLDFGIAKRLTPTQPDAATMPVTAATLPGHVLGSLPYMSPEQAQGLPVNDRSDVFSFGVVLFELFTGRRPFGGATDVETLAKILEAPAPSLDSARHDVPAPLGALVHACLEKDRIRRPAATRVRENLTSLRAARTADRTSLWSALSRRAVVVPVAALLALAATVAAARWASGRDERAARRRVPELIALADKFDFDGFYRAARDVVPKVPDDDHLRQLWLNMTWQATIYSEPSGAEVFIKGYNAPSAEWISVGHTPLKGIRVPGWLNRMRMVKAGRVPLEASLNPFGLTYVLESEASAPAGMVRVPGGPANVESANVTLPAFWVDKYEVTNAEFKAFVDAGGYRRRDWWTAALTAGDRPVTWEAVAAFVDRTGKPGPATWELGTYPDGQKDFPVAGISWYEAAAYAAFAGKSLPTAFQWRAAAGLIGVPMPFSDILMFSNFGMKGPAIAGSHAGLGLWGTYDMAGNVKEWCWNEAAGGRMILGGAWNEPTYMFDDRDAQPALQRLPTYGMRLVKNAEPLPADALAFVRKTTRDYASERPADDATFAVIRNLYRYDARPLDARTELSETTSDWRHERVSFDAAYGGERVTANIYMPRDTPPPYQVVVFFPGGDAQVLSSSRELRLNESSYHVRSGRALVYPIYKGTFERRVEVTGVNARRELSVARVKDIQRTLDYIASRPDLDATRVAYHGISLGAYVGVLALAVEPRFKAGVFLAGGFSGGPQPVEFDPFNFAPRITVPTLMVNGRADFSFPLETSQKPLFRAIGTSPEHKRHAILEGGHLPPDIHGVMREILAWLDRYLGPTGPISTSQ